MEFGTFYGHLRWVAKKREVPLSTALEEARNLGVTRLTVNSRELSGELCDCFRDCGLRTDTVYHVSNMIFDEDATATLRALEMAKEAGAEIFMVIPGFFDGTVTLEEAFRNAVPRIGQVVHRAKELGIRVGMENYGGKHTPYSTVEGIRRFLEEIEDLGAVFDAGNCLYHRQSAEKMWNVMADRLILVHAKDLAKVPKEGVNPVTTPCGDTLYPQPFGKGALDGARLREKILQAKVPITLEHDGYPDGMEFLRESIAFFTD